MKRKTVDPYCFIIISKCYDFHVLLYSEYHQKVTFKQYDLLEHINDSTLKNYVIMRFV